MATKASVKLGGLEGAALTNFAGGPNYRDSPSELADNEVYDSWNITYDERAGAASRLGYQKRNATALGGAGDKVINDFYSGLLATHLTQVGASLYRGDGATSVHTFTTSDCVVFAETDNNVVACHPADGLYYSPDGTTWTKITAANAPTGSAGADAIATLCVAVWQARLWVGLGDGSVHWSNEGDINTWTSTDFNEIWTVDQQPVIALCVGSGQDIQGRPGLIAFKQDSVYRINDAATGAYTVLSATVGAGGPKAVVGVGSRVLWIGRHGIYWWSESISDPVNASDLLRPVWSPDQLSIANQSGWAAGRRLNRAFFSCSSSGSSVNDLAFELQPDEGWIAPRSDAMSCYSTSTDSTGTTSGGSPTTDGQLYTLETGGTDDGAAIDWYLQTRWVTPNSGFQATLWMVRLQGRGSGTMTMRADARDAGGDDYAFSLIPDSAIAYDAALLYDSGLTYPVYALQETEAFYDLGTMREFSLRFSGSATTTASGHAPFPSSVTPEVGEFGLYMVAYVYRPLALS